MSELKQYEKYRVKTEKAPEVTQELSKYEKYRAAPEEEASIGDNVMAGLRVVGNLADTPASLVRTGVNAALDPNKEILPELGEQIKLTATEFPYGPESAPSGHDINTNLYGEERPESFLGKVADFTTETALDPLTAIGFGAGKRAGEKFAGEIAADGTTSGLKAMSHNAATRSISKNVTNSKYLNEGVSPDAMGARIVEEGLAPFLNSKDELYKQIAGDKKLTIKNPESLDLFTTGHERGRGKVAEVSDELRADLQQMEKQTPQKFKMSDLASIKMLQESAKKVSSISGETPDMDAISDIVTKVLKPIERRPIPPVVPSPPPLPLGVYAGEKPLKSAFNSADKMVPPIPTSAKIDIPDKGDYLKVPSSLMEEFPIAPERPFPEPNLNRIQFPLALKKMQEEQAATKYMAELGSYEKQMLDYHSKLSSYRKQVDETHKAKLAQYQQDSKYYNEVKNSDKAVDAKYKMDKSQQAAKDSNDYKDSLENYRYNLAEYSKEYKTWKKSVSQPNYMDADRELSLTEVHRLRQNIGKHLADRAFYASPDKAMAQEKTVLVDLYRILGTSIENSLSGKKIFKKGQDVDALELYKAQNNRVKNLLDIQSSLEAEGLKSLKDPSFIDMVIGGGFGGAMGMASGSVMGVDPLKAGAIGASFGMFREGKHYAENVAPGMMANGADKLGNFLRSKTGQAGSGAAGAAVQRGTINYLKEGKPVDNGRQPQSVPNIPEQFIRTPLPRSTEGLMKNKNFVLGKVAQMAPEMFEAVKDVFDNNPESLGEMAQVLSMKMPHFFEKDKYNRFDGRILNEADKQKAIKDTLLNKDLDSIASAKIITKLNREGLFEG